MTKPIEKAIVVLLLILGMPFLAAWLFILIFGDKFLAFMIGWLFLYFGAATVEAIYSTKKKKDE